MFEGFHRHAKAYLFTAAICALAGLAVLQYLPVSLFPDITFPRIVILADNGEEPAERMMTEVTRPLEEAASSVPGVRLVRSITGRGSTEISVSLDWGIDVQQKLQLLQGRIANIRNQLPQSATIQTEQMQVSVFPILGYSLTSDSLGLVELRDIALYQIRPALMRVRGVARVEVTGGDAREFLVTVSPERLQEYGLDIRQVAEAIQKTNVIASPGLVDNNHQLYLSLVSGQYRSSGEIEGCVLAVRDGVPIRVSDVAEVTPRVADKYIRTTAHGQEAVLINVMKQPTGSTVLIGNDVITELAKLRLPRGVRFENFYDQRGFIESSIRSTRDSIIVGTALAMLVLLAFLRSWRVTIIVAIVVPAIIAVTFDCLAAAGMSINIMTLGGVAAAVGLIIDDSIVVLENTFAHFALRWPGGNVGSAVAELAGTSLRELMPAIVGSTLSTIVIHIPLVFLGGVTGSFFASLSITMVFALIISFLFSISIAPILASLLLREDDVAREVAHAQRRSALADWYGRAMGPLLKYRLVFIPVAGLILAATWWLYQHIGNDFMPEMDEGTFVLDYNSPPGTSLDETNRMLMDVERILLATPEVESYSRRTGTQLGFFLTEPNNGDFLVKLRNARSRSVFDVMAEVRDRVNTAEPGLRIEFGQLMMDVIGDLTNNPSPVEIKLFGNDPALLRSTAQKVRAVIATVPGVVDAFDGIVISGPSLVVRVDPLKVSLAGSTVADVEAQLQTIIRGSTESTIQKGEKLIAIHTRFPDAYRYDVDKIGQLRLMSASGSSFPLRSVATIEMTGGQAEIHREGLRPLVAVTARIKDRDLGGTIREIQDRLSRQVSLPQGVTVEYGGVYQTQQESFRGLLLVALAAVLLVFVVLLFEFGEFAVPVSVLTINLLSLLGVFLALWLTGVTFNISSFVGIIMIIGIVAENAIFVMHNVRRLIAGGVDVDSALVQATQMRARPIMMTTLCAILALTPLSLGIGAGAQMQQPLAIAVIGGFSLSSILLFFGLPLMYRLVRR
jgi:CzcA family heavy metal efflux pump